MRPLLGAVALLALAAGPARAALPDAGRLLEAVADANGAAGRAVALRLELELARGEGEAVGSGELLADPSGRARLELRVSGEPVERHLRLGRDYRASRDGEALASPWPLLPPLALLQEPSAARLAAALEREGVATGAVALGRAEGRDCYVLGGRSPGPERGEPPLRAALWVDLESFEAVRIDRADGVRYRLGPLQPFGRVLLPAWFEAEVGGERELRLRVRRADPLRPGAGAFDPAWLLGQ
jgi:hypothetical protein